MLQHHQENPNSVAPASPAHGIPDIPELHAASSVSLLATSSVIASATSAEAEVTHVTHESAPHTPHHVVDVGDDSQLGVRSVDTAQQDGTNLSAELAELNLLQDPFWQQAALELARLEEQVQKELRASAAHEFTADEFATREFIDYEFTAREWEAGDGATAEAEGWDDAEQPRTRAFAPAQELARDVAHATDMQRDPSQDGHEAVGTSATASASSEAATTEQVVKTEQGASSTQSVPRVPRRTRWSRLRAWVVQLRDSPWLRVSKQLVIDYLAPATEDFSIHWRENHELHLGRWWWGIALGYTLSALVLPWLPWQNVARATALSHMCWLLALLTWAIGLWRMAQGWKNLQWLEQRYQRQLLITTSTDLQQNHLADNKWWLGKGFYWNSKHSFRQQNLQQHLESGQLLLRSHPSAAGKAMGANWLHILEAQEQHIYLDCDHTNGHMLIVGTTGAGKTRAFDLLIQQAILRREAVVIIDPKGDHDLREKALQAAYRLNMADKFLVFNPAYAQQSIALDLLGNYSKTSDLAQRIISLIPSSANAGPFRAVSYKAVLTIIDALSLLDQKITISRIYISLTVGLKPLVVEVLRYMIKRHNLVDLDPNESLDPDISTRELNTMVRNYVVNHHKHLKVEAVINLFELYQHDHAHLTKMIATLLPGLQVLASPPMNDLISPELEATHQRILFNLQSLTTDNYILYVGLDSLSDATLSSNIGSLLLSDLAALAGMIYNYKDVKKPINIFVDEAAEVVNDAFIQILNKGRGAGLRCFTATQTIADFNVRTGSYDKTRQMLGNFNNWLALRTNDYDTQNYLAQSLRRTRVSVKHASYAHHDLLSANNQSDSMHHEQTNLITPDIFAELRNFEYIARVSGGALIKGRLPIVNLD